MTGYIVVNLDHLFKNSPEVAGVVCDEDNVVWRSRKIAEEIAAKARIQFANQAVRVMEVNLR